MGAYFRYLLLYFLHSFFMIKLTCFVSYNKRFLYPNSPLTVELSLLFQLQIHYLLSEFLYLYLVYTWFIVFKWNVSVSAIWQYKSSTLNSIMTWKLFKGKSIFGRIKNLEKFKWCCFPHQSVGGLLFTNDEHCENLYWPWNMMPGSCRVRGQKCRFELFLQRSCYWPGHWQRGDVHVHCAGIRWPRVNTGHNALTASRRLHCPANTEISGISKNRTSTDL